MTFTVTVTINVFKLHSIRTAKCFTIRKVGFEEDRKFIVSGLEEP